MTTPTVSPAMRAVIDHLQELGPRWGLKRDTCAAHGVLYLVGRPMARSDLARCLGLDEAAIEDLVGWRMARRTPAGLVGASGEPWDLLFAAFEERRRRELVPALKVLTAAARSAASDGTPRATAQRIRSLLDLVRDLSTIGDQVGQLSSRTLARLISLGGRVSRILGPTRT
jgi:DNA-binding transcriptional regulator GbsR (MarR family)